jgi:hypothetical protein
VRIFHTTTSSLADFSCSLGRQSTLGCVPVFIYSGYAQGYIFSFLLLLFHPNLDWHWSDREPGHSDWYLPDESSDNWTRLCTHDGLGSHFVGSWMSHASNLL